MMGQQIALQADDEPRRIAVSVAGTAPIERAELIHNGETLHTWPGEGRRELSLRFEHDGPVRGLEAAPDRAYYYVRVRQEGGSVAWSSPTWVDPPR